MIRFETILNTVGDGYWSTVSAPVRLTKLALSYVNDEQDFGELRVYFDTDDWDVGEDGLIYTDSLFVRQLEERLTAIGLAGQDIDYSEMGMQGDNYVSLDVGEDFIASWYALVDKLPA